MIGYCTRCLGRTQDNAPGIEHTRWCSDLIRHLDRPKTATARSEAVYQLLLEQHLHALSMQRRMLNIYRCDRCRNVAYGNEMAMNGHFPHEPWCSEKAEQGAPPYFSRAYIHGDPEWIRFAPLYKNPDIASTHDRKPNPMNDADIDLLKNALEGAWKPKPSAIFRVENVDKTNRGFSETIFRCLAVEGGAVLAEPLNEFIGLRPFQSKPRILLLRDWLFLPAANLWDTYLRHTEPKTNYDTAKRNTL